MSRFNTAAARSRGPAPNTINRAGGAAYAQSDKLALVSLLLTSMLQNRYYENASEQLTRVRELIGKVDPKFAAKAAVYARNEFGLRSISHVAASEIINQVKGRSWTKDFIQAVVRRPDDMTEIMAYHLATYGKPVPNALKKGLAAAFGKFDAYQLAKYKGSGKALSLVDLVNIVHPKPTPKNGDALRRLISGELQSTGTWESAISAAGKAADKTAAKTEAWRDMVESGKIGYFALLRNLRNIMETGDADLVKAAAKLLISETHIRKSLVMPFRFAAAYQAIGVASGDTTRSMTKQQRLLLSGINRAVDISVANVPELSDSLVVVDYSGSMGDGIDSPRGQGTLLGAALARRSNADFMIFGSDAAYVPYNPDDTTLTLFNEFMSHNQESWYARRSRSTPGQKIQVGHGTNFESIFRTANQPYARIFVFSDMQGWAGRYGGAPTVEVRAYERRYKAKPFIYSMDLAGHGDMMFPEDRVAAIPGFSEKIFDLIKVMEQDKDALVKKIESIRFK